MPLTWNTTGSRTRALLLGAALLLVGCGAVTRPDGGAGLLPVGALAPNFEARDAKGGRVMLADAGGSHRIVYFYPKDGTPGCTKEACAFRDAYDEYRTRGVVIFGVSSDSEESHEAFRKTHSLPFPLAADPGGAIQRAYGVPSRLGFASRVSFLVGKEGRVERVWKDVDPLVHARDVLSAVK